MQQFCDYEILSELGRGGMGAVYRARSKDGRTVALKVMRPEFRTNASAEKRFKRAPQLYPKHPNIVEIYDSGECDGTLYFAMQLVEGDALSNILRRVRVFAPEQYAPVLRDIAAGLDGSHAKGVIHRDIKPSNILIRSADGRAFLTDFDIAKDLTAAQFTSVAGAGAMIGTAHYMSPEQASGKQITPASDVYSLGAMTYEALAGRPPFQADSEFVVARMHLQEPPEDLYKVNPAVSEKVSAVVMRALNKDPRQRYASAGGFAQAYSAALSKSRALALPKVLALGGGLTAMIVVAALAVAMVSTTQPGGLGETNPPHTATPTAVATTATRQSSQPKSKTVVASDATAVDDASANSSPTPDAVQGQPTVTPDLRAPDTATPVPPTAAPLPTVPVVPTIAVPVVVSVTLLPPPSTLVPHLTATLPPAVVVTSPPVLKVTLVVKCCILLIPTNTPTSTPVPIKINVTLVIKKLP
ncbi:MAG: protein kinase [Chloroflexi bacterium]|nr:protein kinase [Chloroflexota bacterium]MCL5275593.1 protein kinase [Chloroflexota bacterium]